MSYPTAPVAPVIEQQNPFYITNNSAYGTHWQSANNEGFGALKNDDTPLWRQTVSSQKFNLLGWERAGS